MHRLARPLTRAARALTVDRAADSLGGLVRELLDLYAPARCAACDDPWPVYPPSARAPSLCAACASTLEHTHARALPLVDAIAPYEHGGALARAIHRAKYTDAPQVARALGALLAHALERYHALEAHTQLAALTHVVPVPLHRSRLRDRGYNQALELARGYLATRRRAAHEPTLALEPHALARTRATSAQAHNRREERLSNLAGAFGPGPRAQTLAHARVLLVDDVLTTGATLLDARRAAYEAGAQQVICVTLAHASRRHHP